MARTDWRPFLMGQGPNGLPAIQWVRHGQAAAGEASEVSVVIEYPGEQARLEACVKRSTPPSVYSLEQYQRVCEHMLDKHYGLSLNDTHLCESSVVRECIASGWEPYSVLSEHALEADLDRMDLIGPWGIPSKAALSLEDQQRALAEIGALS